MTTGCYRASPQSVSEKGREGTAQETVRCRASGGDEAWCRLIAGAIAIVAAQNMAASIGLQQKRLGDEGDLP